ncbi:2Fe-2S iron-sulfur cluster binding domain-containing protein [Azoarcus sp. TTM-91]|uniref:PDR/VanB family oxidoreductase n=1 Tax=Azoarcus sp. TTM-91 TaxID=2691581 RepID=UPI00145D619A|nr:PDR/VanB family oxidoreductase [Azoarcus sp. TTM-91]NMG35921.1 2Fe-2S iron-sulfur cluster binding domain-containing protein [Azoarcus sp. TTM-91]
MSELELTVSEIRAETPLIRTLYLQAADGSALPAFTPGAHLKVSIPGLADARCYSLVSFEPTGGFDAPSAYRLGIRLEEESQGGSRHMHTLAVGDRVTVSAPKNDFPLHAAEASEGEVVLLAGGIGITPIAAMACGLQAAGRSYQLHYSGRSRSQLAFLDELASLAGPALKVHADDEADTRLDIGALLDGLKTTQHLYVCGPKGMIDALIEGAKQRGWPADRVHFELFAAAAPLEGDQPFEVELRQSGVTLTVPADKTILDVMEEQGCDPMYDCKRGECGVCTATVLEGVPDHRDYFLSDAERAEGKLIQICISRSKTPRLVLDL